MLDPSLRGKNLLLSENGGGSAQLGTMENDYIHLYLSERRNKASTETLASSGQSQRGALFLEKKGEGAAASKGRKRRKRSILSGMERKKGKKRSAIAYLLEKKKETALSPIARREKKEKGTRRLRPIFPQIRKAGSYHQVEEGGGPKGVISARSPSTGSSVSTVEKRGGLASGGPCLTKSGEEREIETSSLHLRVRRKDLE